MGGCNDSPILELCEGARFFHTKESTGYIRLSIMFYLDVEMSSSPSFALNLKWNLYITEMQKKAILERLLVDFVETGKFEKEGERVLADYWSLAGGRAQSLLPETQKGKLRGSSRCNRTINALPNFENMIMG